MISCVYNLVDFDTHETTTATKNDNKTDKRPVQIQCNMRQADSSNVNSPSLFLFFLLSLSLSLARSLCFLTWIIVIISVEIFACMLILSSKNKAIHYKHFHGLKAVMWSRTLDDAWSKWKNRQSITIERITGLRLKITSNQFRIATLCKMYKAHDCGACKMVTRLYSNMRMIINEARDRVYLRWHRTSYATF